MKGRHSHIVPAGYLRGWAGTDGRISVGWARSDRESELLWPESIGVRSGFYAEDLPDGTTSDWLEDAMSVLEGKALPVLRGAESRWPLTGTDRGRLSEYIALQMMRGPAWRDWYRQALANAERWTREEHPERPAESFHAARQFLSSDAERHTHILAALPWVATAFANMHWTLLVCGRRRLATADHPLVPVSDGPVALQPLSSVPPWGIFATTEFRIALTPRLLLLLTWLDDYATEPIAKLKFDHVRNHNGSVIAHADQHWVHHPNERLDCAVGPWAPLGQQLYRGYTAASNRRRHVQLAVEEMIETQPKETGIRIIEWGVRRAA
jgi:hypothetical protein